MASGSPVHMRPGLPKHPSTLVIVTQRWRVLCTQSVPASPLGDVGDAALHDLDQVAGGELAHGLARGNPGMPCF